MGLKCLSARFVIDIDTVEVEGDPREHSCLKCLSARFVIDMRRPARASTSRLAGLKCLSARFVIDILCLRNGRR